MECFVTISCCKMVCEVFVLRLQSPNAHPEPVCLAACAQIILWQDRRGGGRTAVSTGVPVSWRHMAAATTGLITAPTVAHHNLSNVTVTKESQRHTKSHRRAIISHGCRC